jgi:hypothetical protein
MSKCIIKEWAGEVLIGKAYVDIIINISIEIRERAGLPPPHPLVFDLTSRVGLTL